MNQMKIGVVLAAAILAGGCKDEPKPTPAQTGAGTAATTPAKVDGGGHANIFPLGELSQAGLKFKATQDEPIKAGGEGAFDLLITGYPAGQKPKAVRFWVGLESGEGSVKAKAAEESPDNWHTHVEVPNPLPAGAKFWAEVEPATGEKLKVSFVMK